MFSCLRQQEWNETDGELGSWGSQQQQGLQEGSQQGFWCSDRLKQHWVAPAAVQDLMTPHPYVPQQVWALAM